MRTLPLALLITLALPLTALAGDGRIEINQACAEATGCFPGDSAGFPVTVDGSSGRNFVLTSDLTVPADTDAILLSSTSNLSFDLNGFTIAGAASCSSTACSAGTGSAFSRGLSVAFARHVTVRNGSVVGFGDNCVELSASARVTELAVF